jgi:3-hydroxyisobutyrate dehydrogenase
MTGPRIASYEIGQVDIQGVAMTIGFIGLGNIGKPMAIRLLQLDEPVLVYDVARAPVDELVQLGAVAAADLAELAGKCRMIGICVRDEREVENLLHGGGLLDNAQADTVLAIHSTVSRDAVLRWHDAARLASLHLVDAPITGGASGAAAGTLCYMVGGAAPIVERCRPVFETSGNKVIHAGGVGAGIALKLCNNLMTYASFVAIHEAAKLAAGCGLATELLFEVGKSNGVVTPVMAAFISNRSQLQQKGPEALAAAFGPHAALGVKDLAAALQTAGQLGISLPAAQLNSELIEGVYLNRG